MQKVSTLVSKDIGDTLTNIRTWKNVMYNVLEHRLVGDSTTNDTAALQTLINTAIAAGRRTIFFPHTSTGGKYYVTALTNANQVDFIGDNCSFVGGYTGLITNIGDVAALQAENASQWINVKYPPVPLVAAKGDGTTIDSTTIQNIVNAARNIAAVFIPSGTYKMTAALVLKTGDIIVGNGNSAVLDFSTMTSGSALKLDSNSYVTRVSVEKLKIVGSLSIIGLDLSATNPNNNVDNVFRDLEVYGCNVGHSISWSWCNTFENIRFTSGHIGADINAQANSNGYYRCSFGNMDTNLIKFSNADANDFTACEFYNASHASNFAITLFQSRITITTPYIENIASGNFASVGTLAETTHSNLLIQGGITNSSIIISIGANNVNVEVEGLYSGANNVTINSILPTLNSTFVQRLPFNVSSSDMSKVTPQTVTQWYGNTPCPYAAMGVTAGPWVVSTALSNKKYATISVDKNFAGIQLTSGNLVVGQPHVLAYALRSAMSVYIKHSAAGNLFFQTQAQSEELQVRYLPFIAETTDLSIYFESLNIGVDIALLAIIKGSNFPTFDIREQRPIYGTAAPTTGSWNVGDRVYKSVPVVGQPKSWVCTVAGTPGTWVSEGIL